MADQDVDYDVAIIGGGPAGAAMASYLAQADVSAVVLEKELFPRHHVGESLVPAANRVLADMDLLEAMDEAGFPRKHGAVWTSEYNEEFPSVGQWSHEWADEPGAGSQEDREQLGANIGFAERPGNEGVDLGFTWHVDRSKFDTILLQRAAELGADVHQGVRVSDVDFSEEYPTLSFSMGNSDHQLNVKCVVDASGRRTLLGNKLGLRVMDSQFQQMAVYTWYEGFDREAVARSPDHLDSIYVHFLPMTHSWIWQIPISDTVTSFGVVTQKENFGRTEEEREEFFWECVKTRPKLYEELQSAEQVRPMGAVGDYSYAMEEVCGDNFVLIGDAARFVDPIFSSGVSVALNSAKYASQDIIEAVRADDFSKQRFADYEQTIKQGVRIWYRFITLYYRLNVLFTYYVNHDTYRTEIIKLLQGDVYDDEGIEVLDVMEEKVEEVENDPHHPWHDHLEPLSVDELEGAL